MTFEKQRLFPFSGALKLGPCQMRGRLSGGGIALVVTIGLQLLVLPSAHSQNTVPNGTSSFSDVGAIPYAPLLDQKDFLLCNEKTIAQYYQVSPVYAAGTEVMKSRLRSSIGDIGQYGSLSGIITIRFIINCQGLSGRFRINQVNELYQPYIFPDSLVHKINSAVQQLDHWKPGFAQGRAYDSYYFISFRLKNGTITQIFPR